MQHFVKGYKNLVFSVLIYEVVITNKALYMWMTLLIRYFQNSLVMFLSVLKTPLNSKGCKAFNMKTENKRK